MGRSRGLFTARAELSRREGSSGQVQAALSCRLWRLERGREGGSCRVPACWEQGCECLKWEQTCFDVRWSQWVPGAGCHS